MHVVLHQLLFALDTSLCCTGRTHTLILSLLSSSFRMSSSFLPSFAARTVSRGFAAPNGFCNSGNGQSEFRTCSDSNTNMPPKPQQVQVGGVASATYQSCCSETHRSARLFLCLSFGSCALIPRLQVKLSSLWNIAGGLTFHQLLDGDSVACLQAKSEGLARSTDLSPGSVLGTARHLHATCSCDSFLT